MMMYFIVLTLEVVLFQIMKQKFNILNFNQLAFVHVINSSLYELLSVRRNFENRME